ncbi:MAG: glycoside hydrolase family 88 protein [Oscillospiraceae bacterium]|nr:glycoside hydrolase family 88 protein [Oscillospiraceae bacterium]
MYDMIEAYLKRLIDGSTPDRPLWNIENIRQGKPAHWNYIDGCMITALLSASEITGEQNYADFAEKFIDYYVQEDGSILGYEKPKYNLDDINEGRVLFDLYEMTGKEKYRMAIERLHEQLLEQPRTETGNFWHKKIYPDQVWLDGIYMAQVFSTRYALTCGNGDVSDMMQQIRNVRRYLYDTEKGLLYHGWDCSRRAFWADPETGRSANFWLRAIGWFTVALADIIGYLPDGSDREALCEIFREVIAGAAQYADTETGMYYQVVDCGDREGNYLETSGSSMIAYAMLKGTRLGVLPPEFAVAGKKTFDGICQKYLTMRADGELNLGGICLVAGLGPEDHRRRDGSYEYYISEPVVENDAMGVAPFILCYTEIKRLMT